jgi:hypothetical protein
MASSICGTHQQQGNAAGYETVPRWLEGHLVLKWASQNGYDLLAPIHAQMQNATLVDIMGDAFVHG